MRLNIWPWSTFSRLRYEAQDAREDARIWEKACKSARHQTTKVLDKNAEWEVRYYELQERWSVVMNDNAVLKRQLAEATKNDTRDPTTGRFVKAER